VARLKAVVFYAMVMIFFTGEDASDHTFLVFPGRARVSLALCSCTQVGSQNALANPSTSSGKALGRQRLIIPLTVVDHPSPNFLQARFGFEDLVVYFRACASVTAPAPP